MRHFDLQEANRLVPLLEDTFQDIRSQLTRIQELSVKLESLEESHRERVLQEREALVGSIRERVSALEEMGIEVKALDGLVDFRARMNGRTVFLCWKLGEPSITHWHELETGFTGRRPLGESAPIHPTYLS